MAAFPEPSQEELDALDRAVLSEEEEGGPVVVYDDQPLMINTSFYDTETKPDGNKYYRLIPSNRFARSSRSKDYTLLFEEFLPSEQLKIVYYKDEGYLDIDFGPKVSQIQLDLVLEAVLNLDPVFKLVIRNLSVAQSGIEEFFFVTLYTILYEERRDLYELHIRESRLPSYSNHSKEIANLMKSSDHHIKVIDLQMSNQFDNKSVKRIAEALLINQTVEVLRIQGSIGMDENCLYHFIQPLATRYYLKDLKIYWFYPYSDFVNEEDHIVPQRHKQKIKTLYQAVWNLYHQGIMFNASLDKFDYYQPEWIKYMVQSDVKAKLIFYDQTMTDKFINLHEKIIRKIKVRHSHVAGKKHHGECKKHACCEKDSEMEMALTNHRFLQQVFQNGGRIRIEYD